MTPRPRETRETKARRKVLHEVRAYGVLCGLARSERGTGPDYWYRVVTRALSAYARAIRGTK